MEGRPRRWKFRPSKDDYPVLKHTKDYTKWRERLLVTTCSHGISHLLRFDFTPLDADEREDYQLSSAWFYDVLRRTVKTPTGEKIVRDNLGNMYIPNIMHLLHEDANKSTHAIVNMRELYLAIVTTKLDATYKGTLHSFIRLYEDRVRDYNTRAPEGERISPTMAKIHLRTAVSTCKPLNEVQIRESEQLVITGRDYTYDQYVQMLKHQATLQDTRNASKRSVNTHNLEWQDPSDDALPSDDDDKMQVNQTLSDYIINAAITERNQARMGRATWRSLTPEAQQIWDQLDDENKSKILKGAASKPDKRASRPTRKVQANVSDMTPSSGDDDDDDIPTEDVTEDLGRDAIEVNKADTIEKAVSDAHPADTRKMLGPKTSKREVNTIKFNAFNMNFDDAVEELELDSSQPYGLVTSAKDWYKQVYHEDPTDSEDEDFREGSWY